MPPRTYTKNRNLSCLSLNIGSVDLEAYFVWTVL
jgi:hypothetical protein